MRKVILVLIMFLMILIFSGGCFLQPINKIENRFNFIDMDSPALRVAKPVQAELLEKQQDGSWKSVGTGMIPAGAYIKGRSPKKTVGE